MILILMIMIDDHDLDDHDLDDHGNYDDPVCNQLIAQVQEGAL